MQSLLILGRQSDIGLAELESLYGADKIRPIGSYAALVDVDPCLLAFDRLGGSIKFCKFLTRLETNDWLKIEELLISVSPGHSQNMPQGKMHLGISTYGINANYKQVMKLSIALKRAIQKTGRTVRVIPNQENALSSAQVIHNNLTGQNGWELVILKDKQKTVIAQTVKVQDITAYARRDQARPHRDAKVGMLPPKLAQIIINLAVGLLPAEATQSICEIPPDQPIPQKHFEGENLLDPFCGTGVILQEAAIMGYDCQGSDIDERLVGYAKSNIDWLRSLPRSPISSKASVRLEVGNAADHRWLEKPTIVASETYLGRPLSRNDSQTLDPIANHCNSLLTAFLNNLAGQTAIGTRICLAVPAWKRPDGSFRHLPLLDSLKVIGYNPVRFQHSGSRGLIYHRPNQMVGRELLVVIRN